MSLDRYIGFSPTPYNTFFIAATATRLVSVQRGDPTELAALCYSVQHRFPKARFQRDDARAASWAERLFLPPGPGAIAPGEVLLRGTDFQQRVWRATMRIPYGETATYGEVAAAAGSPGAARAVGTAMSTNSLAIVVPCHRVVGTAGLGGYFYGLDMKRALLAHERQERERLSGLSR